MDSHRSVGHESQTRSREMMRLASVLLLAAVVSGCSSQMRSGVTGFQRSSDAAAIKAMLDTSAAGWNRAGQQRPIKEITFRENRSFAACLLA